MAQNSQQVPERFKHKLAKAADQDEALRILAVFAHERFGAKQVVIYLSGADGEHGSHLSYARWRGFIALPSTLEPSELDGDATEFVQTPSGAELGTDWYAQLQLIRAPLLLPDTRPGMIEVRKNLLAGELTERHADSLAALAEFVGDYLSDLAGSGE